MNVTNSAGSCPAILADGASIHRAKPTGPLSRPDRIGTSSFPIAGPLQNFLFDDRFWPLRVTRRYDRSWPASGHSRRVGHHGVWPKRCIDAERRGLMQISESRYVLLLPLQSHPRDVQTESTPKCRAFRLASPISSPRPLNWRTGSAILKPLVREHRAHHSVLRCRRCDRYSPLK
jgi:hypothetical protein